MTQVHKLARNAQISHKVTKYTSLVQKLACTVDREFRILSYDNVKSLEDSVMTGEKFRRFSVHKIHRII